MLPPVRAGSLALWPAIGVRASSTWERAVLYAQKHPDKKSDNVNIARQTRLANMGHSMYLFFSISSAGNW
jgi:hypothetical protein